MTLRMMTIVNKSQITQVLAVIEVQVLSRRVKSLQNGRSHLERKNRNVRRKRTLIALKAEVCAPLAQKRHAVSFSEREIARRIYQKWYRQESRKIGIYWHIREIFLHLLTIGTVVVLYLTRDAENFGAMDRQRLRSIWILSGFCANR